MTNMKKQHILGTLAVLLAVILPVGTFWGLTASVKDTYSETFVAELSDKFERLTSIDEPKLIVVGGSSVAFGIDSETMERELGRPVVNFGLYATLGTKLMLDLSLAGVGEGDIVLIAPETDPQTLSLYFNAEAAWQAMDSDRSMFRYVAGEDKSAMAGAYYDYRATAYRYHADGVTLSPAGVYRHDSFDEYGDIEYDRPYNLLYENSGVDHDPTNPIELDREIVSREFIDYVNEYTAECESRGAAVYYAFCPMNESAIAEGTEEGASDALFDYLNRELDCKVINSPEDTIYPSNYFYDTNFHLNDAGVLLHTREILTALYREMGKTELPKVELLEMPELPIYEGYLDKDGNDYAECFKYEEYGNGYMIVGTTNEGKLSKVLEVPSSYNGRPVIAIGEEAFSGCSMLMKLTIHRSITAFYDGIFTKCPHLDEVYFDYDDATFMEDKEGALPQVSVELLRGAEADLRIYLSRECFERFVGDYNWQRYAQYFEIGEDE